MSSPIFVCIPGHWHTAVHFEPLIAVLKQQGYQAVAHKLQSVGLKSPTPTFGDDIELIYAAVNSELSAGRDVCLVLHSFAGLVGAEAVNQLSVRSALEAKEGRGTLRGAVFIAALTFPAGFVMDAKEFVGPGNPGFSIEDDRFMRMAEPREAFFNDLPPDVADRWVKALDIVYYLGRGPALSSEDWRNATRITAILCKQDRSVAPEQQEAMWSGQEIVWLDSGHDPYISQPDKVAEVLVRAMGE